MVKKKKFNKPKPDTLADQVLAKFRNKPTQTFNYKQIGKLLKIKQPVMLKTIQHHLVVLTAKKKLTEVKPGKYKLNYVAELVKGVVDMTSQGSAFIISEDSEQDIFVASRNLNRCFNGDLVQVSINPSGKGKRPEGVVTKVIKRKKDTFVGIVDVSKNHAFFIPDDQKISVDFYISKAHLKNALNGQKVIVKLRDWPEDADSPFGEIIEILGFPGEHQTEMHAILAEYGLPLHFPESIEQEAEAIDSSISAEEIKKRRDFRNINTFTIDPHDAKDFDDALSFKKLDDNSYEIGVHIADVTHYVRENTALNKEGYERGTSVYLVDRVVPMLPERLSNNICSLRPHEDKLCFSAVFTMNDKAEVLDTWFGKTIINSNHRFTYDDAQTIIETKEGTHAEIILTLDRLAKKLRAKRFTHGAINFDKVEVKFRLDEKGNPIDVIIKESKDAHQLIEEFMLLANKKVASFIGKPADMKKAKPFVYRVHDSPDPEKLQKFNEFVRQFGHGINLKNPKSISTSLNSLLANVKGKGEENMVEQLAIRTMSKAIYTTNNIGHYGLAFDYYTHFTSPIRRYPDMMVHRLLELYLKGKNFNNIKELEEQCNYCSEREKVATEAERASIKYKQVEFLKDKIGEVYQGIISGLSEWGIYVEIIENKCEGMVRLRDLKEDYFTFDEKKYVVTGKKHGSTYHLGDEVFIKIKRADLLKKQLDFEIIES